MGRYNRIDTKPTKTTTYEGGEAYTKSVEDEWTNMLFSFILQNNADGFYESVDQKESRFVDLTKVIVEKYGPSFVANAAVFTRNELGLRTISELLAAYLNSYSFEDKRRFYRSYFRRPDGVGEVFSAVDYLGGKRSHALVRGACDYLSSLDEYQLGKYKLTKHKYNMFDLINITHANSVAIDKYKRGMLAAPDTWEVSVGSAESKEARDAEWIRLVTEEKLGYLALLRNLRNILNTDGISESWIEEILIPQITNPDKIEKSMVFPYQIYTAWKALKIRLICPIELEKALSDAFKIAAKVSTPELPGKNVIVLDISGSMLSPYSANSLLTIKEVSAVYAAALYLSDNDFDLIKFGTNAKFCSYSKIMNVFNFIEAYCDDEYLGCGTKMSKVFDLINTRVKEEGVESGRYSRMFVFSDMQVADGRNTFQSGCSVREKFSEYSVEVGPCHLFSFDLGNYPSQLVSQNSNISYITTVSNKIFEIVQYLDKPDKSLIDIIKDYRY